MPIFGYPVFWFVVLLGFGLTQAIAENASMELEKLTRQERSALKELAECNWAPAMIIAIGYKHGIEGLKQDRHRAAAFLHKIAQTGQPNAQFMLADQYRSGSGVPKNLQRAFFWARLAENGESRSGASIARNVKSRLNSDQFKALEMEIAAWRPTPC